jgi:hypothetical protein
VIKFEYRRALHQDAIPAPCPHAISSPSATTKPSFSNCSSEFLPGLPAVFSEGLPRAFSAKGSVCSNTFLPGSAQYVECVVTHSKQTTAAFLPGSRIARHRALGARKSGFLTGSGSQTELAVTHSKQTIAGFLTGSRIARCGLLLLILACGAFLAQARYRQPNSEYQARRAKLRSTIKGPVVLFGYTSRQDAGELAVFFQEENFYYLTGHSEPDGGWRTLRRGTGVSPCTIKTRGGAESFGV